MPRALAVCGWSRHDGGRGEGPGSRYNATARPFDWRFTRTDLNQLLARIRQHDRHAPDPTAA